MYSIRLRQVRERLGISQKQIADILDITASHYNHIESEDETIPLKHLNTICNHFDVSLDYIFEFTDIKSYHNSKKEISSIEVGKRLKSFRKENKLTQVKLAEVLNTVHPVITNYENGKHLIATPFLYMVCKKYKISADYLLGKIDKPKYLK